MESLDQWIGWLVLLIGVLLALPLLGVSAIGTINSGFLGWFVALALIAIGILQLKKLYIFSFFNYICN